MSAMVLDVRGGLVQAILSVNNPDKLAHLGPAADAWSLREAYRRAGRG